MTRFILSTPRSRGRHWLRDEPPTQPLSIRADMVARFRAADRVRDRQTWVLFGGILAAGFATIAAPFVAAGMGWL